MDDYVGRPEVVDHVAADVDLARGPVGGCVQDHPGLGPFELVGPAKADLLHDGKRLKKRDLLRV